jgi:DNA repair photolyase
MTTTSILKPSGTGFGWCINQFDGCTHGCKYCYGMVIRRKSYADWINAKSKENVIEKLKKDIRKLQESKVEIPDIFLGSITDSYQPLERKLQLTRQVVQTLKESFSFLCTFSLTQG